MDKLKQSFILTFQFTKSKYRLKINNNNTLENYRKISQLGVSRILNIEGLYTFANWVPEKKYEVNIVSNDIQCKSRSKNTAY